DDAGLLQIAGNTGSDSVDASGVTTASYALLLDTGSGNDSLLGGAESDTFQLGIGDLTVFDAFNGGTGAALDALKFTSSGTLAPGAFTNVSHVEQIWLANGSNSIALSDALV